MALSIDIPLSIFPKIRYVPGKLVNVRSSARHSLLMTPSMESQGKSVPLKKFNGTMLNGSMTSMSSVKRIIDWYFTWDLPSGWVMGGPSASIVESELEGAKINTLLSFIITLINLIMLNTYDDEMRDKLTFFFLPEPPTFKIWLLCFFWMWKKGSEPFFFFHETFHSFPPAQPGSTTSLCFKCHRSHWLNKIKSQFY